MSNFIKLTLATLLFTSLANGSDCRDTLNFEIQKPKYRSAALVKVLDDYRNITKEIYDHEDILKGDADLWDHLFGEPDHKSLTQEERDLLKKDLDGLYAQKKNIEAELDRLTKLDYERISRLIGEQMKDPNQRPVLEEYGQFLELTRFRTEELVPVLLGNDLRPPTPEEEKLYTQLVEGLVAKNLAILYDADSKAAPLISAIAKTNGIGITSRGDFSLKSNGGKIFHFNNPYTVLEAFALGKAPIISNDSTIGLSLAINDQARFLLEPQKRFENTLFHWAKKLPSKDGLNLYYQKISVRTTADKILEAESDKKYSPGKIYPELKGSRIQTANLRFDPAHYKFNELEGMLEYRDSFIDGRTRLRGVGGATIFGSNSLKKELSHEVYNLAYWFGQRGFPIVTGGSGGVMLAANMGAFDAGGESVGIPKVGSDRPKNETLIPTEVHTKTIVTRDYHARISLLIQNRGLIVIEPGGNGTMRELATTIIAMRNNPNPPILIIQDRNYYQPLMKVLNSPAVPEYIKRRIFFAGNTQEVTEIIGKIAPHEKAFSRIEWKNPRSPRHEFPFEFFEKLGHK